MNDSTSVKTKSSVKSSSIKSDLMAKYRSAGFTQEQVDALLSEALMTQEDFEKAVEILGAQLMQNQIEVKEVRSDVARLDNEVQEVKTNVERVEGNVERVEGNVERVEGEVQEVKTDVKAVRKGLKKVEKHILRLESALSKLTDHLLQMHRTFWAIYIASFTIFLTVLAVLKIFG